MSLPSTRSILATAIRRVNAAFNRLDPMEQARVHLVGDQAVDAAILDGSRQRAIAEIEAWELRQLAEIQRAEEWRAAA